MICLSPVSDRLRVLLVTEPGVDGVFRHVEGLATFLRARGHEVDLAYSGRRGGADLQALVKRIEGDGGATLDLAVDNRPGPRDALALYRLNRFVRLRCPEVIHAHSSKAGALVRMLPRTIPAKLFYTPHAYYGLRPGSHWRGRFYNRLERRLGGRGVTINVSESEAGFAAVVLGIEFGRRMTIPNGVNLETFWPATPADRSSARQLLRLNERSLVLGCIARLSPQKDPHTLYRSWSTARARGVEVHLVHVGTGPNPRYAQPLLTSDLCSQVTRVAAMPPLSVYHAVDGLIVTSRYEGMSLVVLEALACGLPLVLSDVPGNDDVLRRQPSEAWSFPAGDASAAAEGIRRWAEGRRTGLANNHRELACRFYDAATTFRLIEHAYLDTSALILKPDLSRSTLSAHD